jgi:hypothetical protein
LRPTANGRSCQDGKHHTHRNTGETRACRARHPCAHRTRQSPAHHRKGAARHREWKKITEAAEKVGLARESLGRALDKPDVAEFLRQKVLRHLATQAARAGAVKGELLDSDNEMVRDRASTFVLGLADIAPASAPSLSVNVEIKAGYVIDLRDEPPPDLRVVSPSPRP